MELDVTDFVTTEDMYDFSHSEFEHNGVRGTAGRDTWNAALQAAERYPYITDDNRNAFDSWVRDFGAWDRDEIAGWSNTEATALLLQFIAGDAREYESEDYDPETQGGRFYCTAEREDALVALNCGPGYVEGARFFFYVGV